MAYRDEVLADNASIFLEFEETSGTPVNSGSQSATVTIGSGTLQEREGRHGNGYTFGSSTRWVDVADGNSKYTDKAFSFEGWIRTTTQTVPGIIMMKGGTTTARLYLNYYGKIHAQLGSTSTPEGTKAVWDGQWHHVVATFSATQMKTYVDGVLEKTTAISGTFDPGTTGVFRVGAHTGGSSYFAGDVDGVAVYDYTLTDQQVADHYNNADTPSAVSVDIEVATASLTTTVIGLPTEVEADTATLSATSHDATIETQELEALNVNFTSDYFHAAGSGNPSMGLGTLQIDGTNKTYFEVPVTNIPADVESVYARLYMTSAANISIGVFQAVDYGSSTSNHTGTAYHTKDLTGIAGNQYVDIEITGAVQYAKANGFPARIALVRTAGTASVAFHSNEGTNKPYARATWLPVPVNVDLTVSTVTASLAGIEPTIDVVRSTEVLAETQTFSLAANDADLGLGAAHDAETATLSTLANEPVVETITSPDATMDLATATVSLATVEPTVSLPISIDVSDTDTVMFGAYDAEVEITYNARVDLDTPIILIDRIPVTDVNGDPVLPSEEDDPYFNATWRTLTGQTYGVGYVYPSGIEQMSWFRFNEFDGDVVTDRLSPYRDSEDTYGYGVFDRITLSNVVKGLNEGPESRHSVHFNGDAYARQQHPTGLAATNDEQVFTPTSLEFTIRTERKTQFLMGGADLMGGYTNVTGGPRWELWTVDGKIQIHAFRPILDRNGNPTGAEILENSKVTGFQDVADGDWHHIVVQIPESYLDTWGARFATEIYVDGELEVRRRSGTFAGGFPDWIGGRTENYYQQGQYFIRAPQLEKSHWFKGDLTEIVYRNGRTLHVDEVTMQRDTMFGILAVRPEAAKVTFDSSKSVVAKGNRPRVLILEFTRGFGNAMYQSHGGDQGDRKAFFPIENQAKVTAALMEHYRPEWSVIHGAGEGKFIDFPGWGEKGIANLPSYPTDKYQWLYAGVYENLMLDSTRAREAATIISNETSSLGSRQYVDPVTDNYRLIDLDHDLNMDDYEVISIVGYPRNKMQWAVYDGIDGDNVEPKTPIRQQLERLMGQVRDQVVNHRKALYLTDPFSAIALGIIDTAEYVPTFKESAELDARLGAYTGVFDWQAAIVDPFFGAKPFVPKELRPDLRDPEHYYSNRGYATRYKDTHANIRQTVRNLVPGLTSQGGWIKTDELQWWNTNPMGNPPFVISRRYEDRSTGLDVGDTFYMNGGIEDPDFDALTYWRELRREWGWVATPMSAINVGTAVTTFAPYFHGTLNHLNAGSVDQSNMEEFLRELPSKAIGNPYGDHAISIAVQPGDVWNGERVTGKVYINFTEMHSWNPQSYEVGHIMKWQWMFPDLKPSEVLNFGDTITYADGQSWTIDTEHMYYNFSMNYGGSQGTRVQLPDTGGSGADWGWKPGGVRGDTGTSGGSAAGYAMQYHWSPATQLVPLHTPTMAWRGWNWLAMDLDVGGDATVGVFAAEIKPAKTSSTFTVEAQKNIVVDLSTARVQTEAHTDANTVDPDVSVLVGTPSVGVKANGLTNEIVLETAAVTLNVAEISPGEISYDWDTTLVLTVPTQIETLILEDA